MNIYVKMIIYILQHFLIQNIYEDKNFVDLLTFYLLPKNIFVYIDYKIIEISAKTIIKKNGTALPFRN